MSVLVLDRPVFVEPSVDEAAARRALRAQIARLEGRGGRAPREKGGPALLSLGALEAVRDRLAAAIPEFEPHTGPKSGIDAQILLERMFADPAAHRGCSVPLSALGRPGCGVYRVKPRLGIIGMLAGWWHVVVSSGCP